MNNLLLTANSSQFTKKNTVNCEPTIQNSKGFTLIELLTVLAIMGILTAIGVFSFQAAQIRARDAQRKSDLKVIASALENYRQKFTDDSTGKKPFLYPDSSGGSCGSVNDWYCSNSSDSPWIVGLTSTYIQKLPKDIKNTSGRACNPFYRNNYDEGAAFTYGYYSAGTVAGKQFILTAKLENPNDPDLGKTIKFGNFTYSNHGCYAITSP